MVQSIQRSAEIEAAIETGRGIVALESTLIAQGLPWPVNWQTAQASEQAVRQAGAVPATVAIRSGSARIGLDPDELQFFARAQPDTILKASRGDLATVLAQAANAATTVSATLYLARRAGISVMATGGLGGVHRQAGTTWDVSCDIDELAKAHGCLVVCAGIKSILDIPATLELMETQGIAHAGWQTQSWPGFTETDSGCSIPTRWDTPGEVADWVRTHRRLNLPGGLVLGRPLEPEWAVDPEVASEALDQALAEADRNQITGKALTPWLLQKLREQTGGRTLEANRRLIVANARLAAEIAVILASGPNESEVTIASQD